MLFSEVLNRIDPRSNPPGAQNPRFQIRARQTSAPGELSTLRIMFGFRNKIVPRSPFFHTPKETCAAAYTPHTFY